MAVDTFMASPDRLVKGFVNSFEDEETETGSPETIEWARAIVEMGDAMWNYPWAVEFAERYIAENA